MSKRLQSNSATFSSARGRSPFQPGGLCRACRRAGHGIKVLTHDRFYHVAAKSSFSILLSISVASLFPPTPQFQPLYNTRLWRPVTASDSSPFPLDQLVHYILGFPHMFSFSSSFQNMYLYLHSLSSIVHSSFLSHVLPDCIKVGCCSPNKRFWLPQK